MSTILFIEFVHSGGPPNRLIDLITFINKNYSKELKIIVVCSNYSILKKKFKNGKVVLHTIPFADLNNLKINFINTLILYFQTLIRVFYFSVKYRAKIIYANHYSWSAYANPLGFLLNKQVIIHLRDIWPLGSKAANFLLKFNQSTTYVAISHYVKSVFVDKFKIDNRKIKVIYDGINNNLDTSMPISSLRVAQKRPDKKIVMIGRVERERNIEIFIDTAYLLKKKYPYLRFIHYGLRKNDSDETYFLEMQKRIKAFKLGGFISFKPYINNHRKIALVLSSSFLNIISAENFALPNIAIESLLIGVPVIAYNNGGNPEVIKSEYNGILVKYNTAALYTEAIEKCIKNPDFYKKLTANARVSVLKKFSAAENNKRITELILRNI